MSIFREIKAKEINENVFDLIGRHWMLITSGNNEHYNTMTASWGGFGVLWNFPVTFIFIRPQRYTYRFVAENDLFTLNFFDKKYKKILNYCGSHSGKDVDKVKECGLIPVKSVSGAVYFEQAKLVMVSEKIYFGDIDPCHFVDMTIGKNYPEEDYHRMFVGKVLKCLVKN